MLPNLKKMLISCACDSGRRPKTSDRQRCCTIYPTALSTSNWRFSKSIYYFIEWFLLSKLTFSERTSLPLYNALYGMRKFELELFLWDFEIWPNRAKELFFFLSSFFLLSSFFQPSVFPIFDNVPMLRSF